MMATGFTGAGNGAERLSALVDGEVEAGDAAIACQEWRHDSTARRDWHAYQVIGDVLRSEDLAQGVLRDEAFLIALRSRLASEPVVLAPAPSLAVADRSSRAARWGLPAAVAAGFVLVAGTFTVLRPATTGETPAIAAAPASRSGTLPASVVPAAEPVRVATSTSPTRDADRAVVADIRVMRDARLDRYLAAHKQFAGSTALGVPSTFLRSATVDASAR